MTRFFFLLKVLVLALGWASPAAQARVLVRQLGAELELEFQHTDARAGQVAVAGSFNQWSASSAPMQREGETWRYVLRGVKPDDVLHYKFVVGTSQQWLLDPEAPDTSADGKGGLNGLVVVRQHLPSAQTVRIPADLAPGGLSLEAPLSLPTQALRQPGNAQDRNLMPDPGFEASGLSTWTLRGDTELLQIEREPGNLHGGGAALKYAEGRKQPFQLLVLKRLAGLKPGTYRFSAWAMGGGGEPSVQLFARDCGGPERSTPVLNTGWPKWRAYSVPGIVVQGSECTLGLFVQGQAGQWGLLDDLSFEEERAWSRIRVEGQP
jgi:hypothetical protein